MVTEFNYFNKNLTFFEKKMNNVASCIEKTLWVSFDPFD